MRTMGPRRLERLTIGLIHHASPNALTSLTAFSVGWGWSFAKRFIEFDEIPETPHII